MSWVTDVIICLNLEEKFDDSYNILETCKPIEEIRSWLKDKELGELNELTPHMLSGGKIPQSYVYGGSFNHLDVSEFVKFVYAREWREPEHVQVLINDEEDMSYTLHQPNA